MAYNGQIVNKILNYVKQNTAKYYIISSLRQAQQAELYLNHE